MAGACIKWPAGRKLRCVKATGALCVMWRIPGTPRREVYMGEGLEPAVKEFFDNFVATFSSFDGDRVATKFSLPCMAKGPGEACYVFDSRSALAEYFQSYLDEYYSQGCRECHYSNLSLHWLGSESVVASVTWHLTDTSGASVISWSEAYMLTFVNGRAFAFATVDHVGE
ncbi:hypothetical protein Maqu_2926 [Marinobacter nauticus VT8]|uniref:SnoaL-like domain-containing protein n=2 Tax=Marinobacter nauticus TaxID=2743 RepID=A1U4T1_MARN8|nr:hypothetical protein Maqu_2926 [Marinobacter nauticus VT8]